MQNAGMYTMGTTMMGGGAFRSSLEEACDCVPDQSVAARQKEELLDFYQKYAPGQSSKGAGLLVKYSENFPRLMMMLNQKYRESVAIIAKDEKMVQTDEFKRLNPPAPAEEKTGDIFADQLLESKNKLAEMEKKAGAKPSSADEEEQEL